MLLNDLFGIQSRSGCLCSGPYGQDVLGISVARAAEFEAALLDKNEVRICVCFVWLSV